jgi:hypothetical protein
VRVSAYAARYPTADHVVRFFDDVRARVEKLPGTVRVGAGSSLPLSGQMTGTSVMARGREVQPGSRDSAGWQFVSPGYFQALGLPLVRGRDFQEADLTRGGHVTIINDDLARTLFGSADPIGAFIAVGGGDARNDWHQIIGVVGSVRHQALTRPPGPRVYDLFGEHWDRTVYVVVRTAMTDPSSVLPLVRQAVAASDAEAPVFEAAAMSALVERSMAPHRLAAGTAAALAGASLLLAILGVCAMASASVAERAHEIGVRAALGARPRDLLTLVLGEAALTACIGGLAGAAASFGVARLLTAQIFGVRSLEAMLLIPVVTAALVALAVAATIPQARRAAAADPLAAIRGE